MARQRTGSIRWKNGAWRVQVYLGRDDAGRPRYKSSTVHAPQTRKGEAEARGVLARLQLQVDAGRLKPVRRGSFGELVERWIETRTPDWPDGAPKHTRRVLENHVLPTLRDRRIELITPSELDALYGRLRLTLSAATVLRIHASVRAAFQQAVKWGLIDTNPASRATRPKVPTQAPRRIPDPGALRAAIEAVEDIQLAMLLRLAIHTGARRGELVRLRWEDVALGPEGEWAPGAVGVAVFHQTKTDRYKHIPLGPATTAELERYRRMVADQAAAAGIDMPLWVFPSWKLRGAHLHSNSVTHAWRRIRDAVDEHGERRFDLAGVRLHDMRHTMISVLLNQGHDVSTVGDRSGHANKAVLLGVYAHSMAGADVRAAEAMDRWFSATE